MANKMDYESQLILLLSEIEILKKDLEKSNDVNMAAQRARVQTVRLANMFKVFRKESVQHFKDKRAKS